MDLARALAADLRDLAVDLTVDGYTRTTIAMIEHNLRRNVTSVLGASITLDTPTSPETPVVVNFVTRTISPSEIADVLEVALPGLVPPRTASVVFYAAEPDAFAQLRPLLLGELHLDPTAVEAHRPWPTTPISPHIDGLRDFAIVNRALGVLLHRGHTLDSARVELARLAALTETGITAAAEHVLGSAHP